MTYTEALHDFVEIINHKYVQLDPEALGVTIEEDGIYSDDWVGRYTCEEADPDNDYGQILMPHELDREAYRRLCSEVLDRVLEDTESRARYYDYQERLRAYAKDFSVILKQKWQCFSEVGIDAMNIQVSWTACPDKNGKPDYKVSGDYHNFFDGIQVYSADPKDEESNKQTIRHEILHRMLCIAGLPWNDNSYAFWFMATLYDAAPYKEMDELNRKGFDILQKAYTEGGIENVDQIFRTMQAKAKETEQKAVI